MLNHELVPLLLEHAPSSDLLREQYGVDLSEAELLKDNFNLVFAQGPFILRFSPAIKKGLSEIRAELKWLSYLTARGISVNRVIPTNSGAQYLHIEVGEDKLYCVVFEKMEGDKIQDAEWTKDHYRKLGDLTGRLHQASASFQNEVDQDFTHWNEQSKCASFNFLPEDERQLPLLHQALHQKFIALPRSPSTYGVIHYDIHQGNFFLLRDLPGSPLFLFDFEMTCQGWYLLDIAVILYYASNYNSAAGNVSRTEFEPAFLSAFQETYAAHKPDTIFNAELIQDFLLYRDLMVYGYVLEAWQGRVRSEGDLRFLAQLEGNITERRARWEKS